MGLKAEVVENMRSACLSLTGIHNEKASQMFRCSRQLSGETCSGIEPWDNETGRYGKISDLCCAGEFSAECRTHFMVTADTGR
jgi:hypothetical protein